MTSDALVAQLAPRIVAHTNPPTVALLPFSRSDVRAVIHEAKYHGSPHALELLASVLTEYLAQADDIGRAPILVPIPLGSVRRKERGFNQVEELAKRVQDKGGIDVQTGLLVRMRETASQVSLPKKEREINMRGAFSAAPSLDPARTYIVIDDVITTGATLQAAIDALRAAGARHIIPIALAH